MQFKKLTYGRWNMIIMYWSAKPDAGLKIIIVWDEKILTG